MKILSRDFTKTEKLLILFLVLLLLGLSYYRYIYVPIEETISNARAERDALSAELTTQQAALARIKKMREEMDETDIAKDRMASYNNFDAEVQLLNEILMRSRQYTINFDRLTRNGDQIRRSFRLQFTTYSFADAKEILLALTNGEFRCLLGDMSFSATEERETGRLLYSASVTATFYETMVGGVADAGLPNA